MKRKIITPMFVFLMIAVLIAPTLVMAHQQRFDDTRPQQGDDACFEAFETELMDYLGFEDLDELFDLLDSMSDEEIDALVTEAGLMDMLLECEGDGPPDDDRSDGRNDDDNSDNDPATDNSSDNQPTGDDFFAIASIPDDVHPAFQAFSKYVNVFGVHIFATQNVTDAQVLHTANVMAQYLDNDADGEADNPLVLEAMIENQAAMVVFAIEEDLEQVIDDLEPTFEAGILSQDLYGTEIHPNGGEEGRFDTTLEEVLHLITHAGYAEVYPDIFGEESGSAVAEAMDGARGGHFESIPSAYPSAAWYTYDDPTCDYSCQVTEYIYWALTSILGAQDDAGRLDDIENEWRLNTPELVEATDPMIYAILTNPEYALPTVLPDGDYQVEE